MNERPYSKFSLKTKFKFVTSMFKNKKNNRQFASYVHYDIVFSR